MNLISCYFNNAKLELMHILDDKSCAFTFFHGLTSFFGQEERRIERVHKCISSQDDSEALKSDWIKIGGDIRKVLDKESAKLKKECATQFHHAEE